METSGLVGGVGSCSRLSFAGGQPLGSAAMVCVSSPMLMGAVMNDAEFDRFSWEDKAKHRFNTAATAKNLLHWDVTLKCS